MGEAKILMVQDANTGEILYPFNGHYAFIIEGNSQLFKKVGLKVEAVLAEECKKGEVKFYQFGIKPFNFPEVKKDGEEMVRPVQDVPTGK